MTRAARRRARWSAAVIACSGVAFVTAPARAQVPGKDVASGPAPKSLSQTLKGPAKADFDAARLLAGDGDYAGALIKFKSAYEASKDPRLLWNVAFCQKNLRHYSKVIATLQRYLDEGSATLTPKDKQEAHDLITTIEPFTTRATFAVSEDGAQIFVDDEPVGTSPLAAPVVLDIGERKVRVVEDGFRPYERQLVVGGSADVHVEVTLEKEVHEGTLLVEAPAGASIFLDDQPIGTGKSERTLASGGHQLRVTAPNMRAYLTEVVIQDKETRSLNVILEPAAPTERPMLRVAVGCGDAVPRAPEADLVVGADGPDVLSPGPVKRRWSEQDRANVVEYVEYPIPPGPHTIRVSITDCAAREQGIVVDPVKGASISGALESNRFILVRGPEGTPGPFRAAVGTWLASAGVSDSAPEAYTRHGVAVSGAVAEVGAVVRWFAVYLDGAYGAGSLTRSSFNTHYALPSTAHVTWDQLVLRFGPRFPFHTVSLGFGPLVGVEEVDVAQVRTGVKAAVLGAYGEIDVAPLCDWGVFAQGGAQKPTNDDDASASFQFGVFFAPNPRCRTERRTQYGLRTEGP